MTEQQQLISKYISCALNCILPSLTPKYFGVLTPYISEFLCLVFRWQAYPIRNMAWLLYPGSLADLTSALTGAADSLRWGVYHLYYRLPSPLLIPGGQANSSLQLINNLFDPLKGCWGNFLGSSVFCGYQRLGVSCQGLSAYPSSTDHYARLIVVA